MFLVLATLACPIKSGKTGFPQPCVIPQPKGPLGTVLILGPLLISGSPTGPVLVSAPGYSVPKGGEMEREREVFTLQAAN